MTPSSVAVSSIAAPLRDRSVRSSGHRLLHSAGVRFAAIYAILLGISAAALAMFLWWATAGLLDRQTEAAIQADAQSLAERYIAGGLQVLVLTIEDRLSQDVEDDAIYLLTDPAGRRIAGNLEHWPQAVTQTGLWCELPIERAGARSLARVQSYILPGGLHLLIGRDVHVRAQLRSLLTDALLWALLVVAAMASVGALVVRSLFRRTIANVSATAAAVAAGDFAQRVRLSGRGDEFDQLAETINDMLDRIGRLMEGVREVSNAIAHDLRTPITRARTRLEDAALHAGTATELRAAIERATADLDGIVAVFQALLRIAEIEAGSRRAAFARLDLAPLIADVAELYGAVAEEKGVALSVEASGALVAFGDRELIQQALANLVDNAVKFSPSGAAVRITAVAEPREVWISVADQGPGIPAADVARATERFLARWHAIRPGPVSASRWFRRWHNCTVAHSVWRMRRRVWSPFSHCRHMASPIPSADAPANGNVMPVPPRGEPACGSVAIMLLNARGTFLALLASFGLGAALLGVTPVVGQSQPQLVTSDTPEYCLQLQGRVSEMVRVASVPPPAEVSLLSSEGQRMCDQGQTRGGIVRLRRALMILTHQGGH